MLFVVVWLMHPMELQFRGAKGNVISKSCSPNLDALTLCVIVVNPPRRPTPMLMNQRQAGTLEANHWFSAIDAFVACVLIHARGCIRSQGEVCYRHRAPAGSINEARQRFVTGSDVDLLRAM